MNHRIYDEKTEEVVEWKLSHGQNGGPELHCRKAGGSEWKRVMYLKNTPEGLAIHLTTMQENLKVHGLAAGFGGCGIRVLDAYGKPMS